VGEWLRLLLEFALEPSSVHNDDVVERCRANCSSTLQLALAALKSRAWPQAEAAEADAMLMEILAFLVESLRASAEREKKQTQTHKPLGVEVRVVILGILPELIPILSSFRPAEHQNVADALLAQLYCGADPVKRPAILGYAAWAARCVSPQEVDAAVLALDAKAGETFFQAVSAVVTLRCCQTRW
jgi:hypothetical protein